MIWFNTTARPIAARRTARAVTGAVIALGLIAVTGTSARAANAAQSTPVQSEPEVSLSTADHTKFKELDGPFATGPEVTKACLGCHTEASKQIHKTKHWNWDVVNPSTGRQLGKKNIINNFCGSVVSNEARCTSCHIGYGWEDGKFDFAAQENVDCLVCHDTTTKYRKFTASAGQPAYEPRDMPGGKCKFI